MAYEQGYDVLRLIEHSESCYVSSEYVRGRTLIRYIREEKRDRERTVICMDA